MKKLIVSFTLTAISLHIAAQMGAPIYLQNFGRGNDDIHTVGDPLPAGVTSYTYSKDLCPDEGSYTIARLVDIKSCFDKWILLMRDDDYDMDLGNMMIVNNNNSITDRYVYKDTVNQILCPGVTYHYGFSAINLYLSSFHCEHGPDYPVFEFRIEDDMGNLIKKDTTRPGVGYASPPQYKFNRYGLDFVMPAGVNRIVLKLTLIGRTYLCAEDFAIDRIYIAPLGPKVNIQFDGEPPGTLVKGVCFQDNKTISMTGSMNAYYPNPLLQWQQSINNGVNWTDIPGATGNTYSSNYPTPDTFLIRLSGGDASNMANPNCRVISNLISIQVDGLPSDTVSNNSPVCSGQDLQFHVGGGAAYTWSGPNGFTDNINSPHIYFSTLADSGMYYVNVTSFGGCTNTDSTRAVVIGTDVHAGPDTSICKGRSVQLKASDGIKYEWSPSAGLSSTIAGNPFAKPDATTTYIVKVTGPDGCSDTAHVKVTVVNETAVKAMINGPDFLCRFYDSASFNDVSAGMIATRNWDFGNGIRDTTVHPPMQYYNLSGNENSYVVILAVSDGSGCRDTAYHLLKVEDNCYIAVPSAFTPNGDGLNDYLYPLHAYKATNLLFIIYNRSGELVFETRDWNQKWDGTFGGIKQSSGVYVWMLTYTDAGGKRISLKGTTALIR